MTVPRPVSYIDSRFSGFTTMPPPGRSGPGITFKSCSVVTSGSSSTSRVAFMTSAVLCGGIEHAIAQPTPIDPFTSRLGKVTGSTVGICLVSSKLGS